MSRPLWHRYLSLVAGNWMTRLPLAVSIRAAPFCAAVGCALLLAAPASAAQCGGDFNTFIAAMSREAAAAGISREVIASALGGVTPDPAVLAFDRRQRGMFHARSFEQY